MHESEVKDQRQAVAFRFLTWNLSMLVTSAQAPERWDGEYTEQAISRFIEREQPHWVFLQEVSGLVPPFVDGYVLIRQQVESHCGNVMTLLHRDLAELPITHTVVDRFAVLSELHGMDTAIANVHLAPGKTAAPTRLEMLARLREVTSASRLLIVGDTNTRLAEVSKIGRLGFTGEKPPIATWDSRRNRFRSGQRGYTAYYTRYFASGDLRVGEVTVHDRPLHVDGRRFFLSDHFALSGKMAIPLDAIE